LTTDAPLQNNLKELFAILNFISPEIFFSYEDLDSFLRKEDTWFIPLMLVVFMSYPLWNKESAPYLLQFLSCNP